MKNEDNFPWGARIERGRIVAKYTENNAYFYDVESIDLPGATLYKIPGDDNYTADTAVFFFAFEDGKGAILRPIL